MKETTKLILTVITYGAIVVLASIVFIALFHTPLFKNINVFFYRGVILLFISSFTAVGLMLVVKKLFRSMGFNIKDCIVVFFLFFGITLGWFVLIPVTVERSISVYMLSYMDQNDTQGITSNDFADVFYENYITNYGAFDKRFDEQITSANIEQAKEGEGYVITNNGRFIVKLFRLCAKMFDTEKWLVYPNDYEIGYTK